MSGSPPPPSPSSDADAATFEERSALNRAMTLGAFGGAFGLVTSAIQNSLGKHKQGALGIFTRTGSNIGLFALAAAAFGFTESFVANQRQKDDSINSASGACATGLVAGASVGSIPIMFGSCAGMATLIGTFDAAGRSLSGSLPQSAPALSGAIPPPGTVGHGGHGGVKATTLGWREDRERRREQFFQKRGGSESD